MYSLLSSRLDRLEAANSPASRRPWRSCCVIASDADEASAFADANGFADDGTDNELLLVVNLIVGGEYRAPYFANEYRPNV
jgi:hypothetical protein